LIVLDRDGVLNQFVIDPEQGTIDSPLNPDQVRIIPTVPAALERLTRAGYGIVIASNQPSAAKGKTTRANLEKVHARVLEQAQSAGGLILSSHICYHRAEDRCDCRKPRTGLLEAAFKQHRDYARELSWMVGDGIIDIEAGARFGIRTALIAKHKAETAGLLKDKQLTPSLWADDLLDFAAQILK
jgi:D-glycero-D-manno-heptose 1,7-bisphosphate phosphatase